MARYYQAEISSESAGVTTLRIDFGERASNDLIMPDALAALSALCLAGGRGLKFDGKASLPVAMALAHEVAHLYGDAESYNAFMDRLIKQEQELAVAAQAVKFWRTHRAGVDSGKSERKLVMILGIAIAFALAAADRARRREASALVWGGITLLVCVVALVFGGLWLLIPVGIGMVIAAAKLGKTSKKCPSCGKVTPIDALACPHCGASPRTMFNAGQ
jgi:hypothetical protein